MYESLGEALCDRGHVRTPRPCIHMHELPRAATAGLLCWPTVLTMICPFILRINWLGWRSSDLLRGSPAPPSKRKVPEYPVDLCWPLPCHWLGPSYLISKGLGRGGHSCQTRTELRLQAQMELPQPRTRGLRGTASLPRETVPGCFQLLSSGLRFPPLAALWGLGEV